MTTPIRRTCFVLFVLGLMPLAASAAQELPTSASASFEALDTNRDGIVSKHEYDSDVTFSNIDGNHDYRISAAELESILGPQEDGTPSAADRIRTADRNEDGELNDEELRRAAEMRFQWLDTDHNGELSLAEMKSGFGIPAQRP